MKKKKRYNRYKYNISLFIEIFKLRQFLGPTLYNKLFSKISLKEIQENTQSFKDIFGKFTYNDCNKLGVSKIKFLDLVFERYIQFLYNKYLRKSNERLVFDDDEMFSESIVNYIRLVNDDNNKKEFIKYIRRNLQDDASR